MKNTVVYRSRRGRQSPRGTQTAAYNYDELGCILEDTRLPIAPTLRSLSAARPVSTRQLTTRSIPSASAIRTKMVAGRVPVIRVGTGSHDTKYANSGCTQQAEAGR